jgi:hypothetical protein
MPDMTMQARIHRPWPLMIIAIPAAVAVWSGWVGLGALCGFGTVHPLPGIWDGLHINTDITLPVGVESYGAYALYAWLASGAAQATRTFARRSALGALGLGCLGQISYHLLAAFHVTRPPVFVVALVACLPVVTLSFAAALAHLMRSDIKVAEEAAKRASEKAAAKAVARAGRHAAQTGTPPAGLPDGTPLSTTDVRQIGRQKGATPDATERAKMNAKAKRLLSATPRPTLAEVADKTGLSERTVSRINSKLPDRLKSVGS